MTVVVADTSPINYLALIGQIEILRALYVRVVVPAEVLDELVVSGAPTAVREWLGSRSDWLEVPSVHESQGDPALDEIDPGERAAIVLAQTEPNVLLLIDDAAGRAEANRRGIPNTGTLGVLRTAAVRGLLDLPTALARLAGTNFRVSSSLLDALLAEDAQRRK